METLSGKEEPPLNRTPNDLHRREEADDDIRQSSPGSLPKPLRTFSYFFFGIVFLVGVFGWFVSSGR